MFLKRKLRKGASYKWVFSIKIILEIMNKNDLCMLFLNTHLQGMFIHVDINSIISKHGCRLWRDLDAYRPHIISNHVNHRMKFHLN